MGYDEVMESIITEYLDELGIPKAATGATYSVWGRVSILGERMQAAEAELEVRESFHFGRQRALEAAEAERDQLAGAIDWRNCPGCGQEWPFPAVTSYMICNSCLRSEAHRLAAELETARGHLRALIESVDDMDVCPWCDAEYRHFEDCPRQAAAAYLQPRQPDADESVAGTG